MGDNSQIWRLEIYTCGPSEQWYPLPGEHPSLELALIAGGKVLKALSEERRERPGPDEVWVIFPDGRQKQRVFWNNTV